MVINTYMEVIELQYKYSSYLLFLVGNNGPNTGKWETNLFLITNILFILTKKCYTWCVDVCGHSLNQECYNCHKDAIAEDTVWGSWLSQGCRSWCCFCGKDDKTGLHEQKHLCWGKTEMDYEYKNKMNHLLFILIMLCYFKYSDEYQVITSTTTTTGFHWVWRYCFFYRLSFRYMAQ